MYKRQIELFLADEVHRDVVLVEVVRHLDDLLLHRLGVGAFLEHHPALARVLLTRGQLRVAAGAHRIERGGHRDGVLARIGHAGDAAQRVGMPLDVYKRQVQDLEVLQAHMKQCRAASIGGNDVIG